MTKMTLEEFVKTYCKRDSKRSEALFHKEFERGKWCYLEQRRLEEEDVVGLLRITKGPHFSRLLHFFNKKATPGFIKVKELPEIKAWCESNNIYTIMNQPFIAFYEGSFQIRVGLGVVEVTHKWREYNRISMRDINSFM